MARIATIPIVNREPGRHEFADAAVPQGDTRITAELDRSTLTDPAVLIGWGLELSLDGGQTWLPWGAATCAGGQDIDPATGQPFARSSFTVPLPPEGALQRRVRPAVTLNRTASTILAIDTV